MQVKISAIGSIKQVKISLNGQKKTELSISLSTLGNSLRELLPLLKIGLIMLASPMHLKTPDNGLKMPGMMLVLL